MEKNSHNEIDKERVKTLYVAYNFISNAAKLLGLGQTVKYKSIIIFNNFYTKKKAKKYNFIDVCMSCILIASKLEEENYNLKRIICVFNFLISEYENKPFCNLTVNQASKMKEKCVIIEMNMLKRFSFNPLLINPYKHMISFCLQNKIYDDIKTFDGIMSYLNDLLVCPSVIKFKSYDIIWLAVSLFLKRDISEIENGKNLKILENELNYMYELDSKCDKLKDIIVNPKNVRMNEIKEFIKKRKMDKEEDSFYNV